MEDLMPDSISADFTASPFSLEGKTIWVVGGTGYLGQAVTHFLCREGAKVLCIDREDKSFVFAEEAKLGSLLIPSKFDLSVTKAIPGFVAENNEKYGCPDGLVNLAFAASGKSLDKLEAQDFDQVIHSELTATFLLARAVGLLMEVKQSGSIVLFGSMYGMGSPDQNIYAPPLVPNPIEYGVGKAGIIQMARYLGMHFGPKNIRCNSISPGPFPNGKVQKDHPDFIKCLEKRTFLGRVGRATEVAGSVGFLLSNASTYITGHNLVVDGGWTAW
ncbi:short-chain dehydrogenase/reductase SDR [Cyclobacterium marinum DSM 745]|uniref:Short-chain dehydrogenase/reductase SDR n=2 Tax=Cyclobacterium marinum TaxID=104 RepID=G0IZ41_CYCMS|nr:short-chain dehydrogenase/reductase SDR [Cyclobacterium marinum DSM 745]